MLSKLGRLGNVMWNMLLVGAGAFFAAFHLKKMLGDDED